MNKKTIILLLLGVMIVGVFLLYKGASTEPNTTESQTQVIKNITPDEAHVLIQKNKDNSNLVILDVRTQEEFADEHIENAVNLDYYSQTFRDDLNKLDKNKTYVIHCRSGGRSTKTLDMMEELGFIEVYNMMGGIVEWKEKGLPTKKETKTGGEGKDSEGE
jgi:rhodanese-related sulfurtransferase